MGERRRCPCTRWFVAQPGEHLCPDCRDKVPRNFAPPSSAPEPLTPVEQELDGIIDELIWVTHPDRNGDSEQSNDLTCRLLHMRRELRHRK